ncbi:unnamed protein product [Arctogadus glacialis]
MGPAPQGALPLTSPQSTTLTAAPPQSTTLTAPPSQQHPHCSTTGGEYLDVSSEHHPPSTTLTAAPQGASTLTSPQSTTLPAPQGESTLTSPQSTTLPAPPSLQHHRGRHHPHCSTTGGEYPDVSSEHHPHSTTGGEYPDVFSQHQPHSSSSTTSQHHKGRVTSPQHHPYSTTGGQYPDVPSAPPSQHHPHSTTLAAARLPHSVVVPHRGAAVVKSSRSSWSSMSPVLRSSALRSPVTPDSI